MNALAKNLKISYKKLGLISKFIRGQTAEKALRILTFEHTKAAKLLLNVLQSAKANALVILRKQGLELVLSDYIIQLIVGRGDKYGKSHLARAKGRVSTLISKTSHVRMSLIPKICLEKTCPDIKSCPATGCKSDKCEVKDGK